MEKYILSKEIAAEKIIETGKMLMDRHLVAGSWGNISIKVGESAYAVTPSGKGYASLKNDDIVFIDRQCNIISGKNIPSSESKLHTAIYAAFPEAGAVIHTHSIYASALAAMRKPILPIIEDIVQIIGGKVACAEYALPGTEQLACNAVAALNGRKAALLANHGAVCWGKNAEDALMVAEILEKAAQIAVICQNSGGAVVLSDEDVKIMHDFYIGHYSKRQMGEEE